MAAVLSGVGVGLLGGTVLLVLVYKCYKQYRYLTLRHLLSSQLEFYSLDGVTNITQEINKHARFYWRSPDPACNIL